MTKRKARSSWSVILSGHRMKSGIKQDDFAKMLGLTQGIFSRYERGVTVPPLALLDNMCVILDLSSDERRTFIEEAHLAHAPAHVRSLVSSLRRQLQIYRALLAKHGIDAPAVP